LYFEVHKKTAYRDPISRFVPKIGRHEGYPFTFVKSKYANAMTNCFELNISLLMRFVCLILKPIYEKQKNRLTCKR